MNVIAGCIIQKENKILMVKEAKKEGYGQWCYPAGKVDQFEKITDAAIREVFEETGCKVELKGVLPIITVDLENRSIVVIRFIADIVEENINFDKYTKTIRKKYKNPHPFQGADPIIAQVLQKFFQSL